MKKNILFLFFLSLCINNVNAQKITLKSVSPLPMDLSVQNNPNARKDQSGNVCALIRVGVVGVEDLVFPDAVGNVKRSLSEYLVYVPEGLKSLKYRNPSGTISGSVSFEDNDIEKIESKRVYSVVFESENHLRAAIFSVRPKGALLTFDGIPVKLDAEGMAVIEKPVGIYRYSALANEYEPQSGTIKLTEDDISTTTSIRLRQKQYPFTVKCNPSNATLFVDNVSYGQLDKTQNLQITGGSHSIRLTAPGYEDLEQTIIVNNSGLSLNLSMTKMQEEIVRHNEERSRTKVNLPPAYYTSIGAEIYNKKEYLGHDWSLKLSFGAIQHFAGALSIYEGLAGGIMNLDEKKRDEWFENPADSANTYFIEVPLMIGASVPFGKYNKNMISILGGAYGKVMLTEIVNSNNGGSSKPHGNSLKTNWDYGLRGMIILDISRFSIAAEVGLSLAKFDKYKSSVQSSTAQSVNTKTDKTNSPNLFFGVTLGAKLGKL